MKSRKIVRLLLSSLLSLSLGLPVVSCERDNDDFDTDYYETVESDTSNGSGSSHGSSSSKSECNYCYGSGVCSNDICDHGTCMMCDGKGYTMSGKYKNTCAYCSRGKCNACKGSGKCSKCGGKGYR